MRRELHQREQFATRFVDFAKAVMTASECNDDKSCDDHEYRVEPEDDTPAGSDPKAWYIHRYSERGWDGIIKFR